MSKVQENNPVLLQFIFSASERNEGFSPLIFYQDRLCEEKGTDKGVVKTKGELRLKTQR